MFNFNTAIHMPTCRPTMAKGQPHENHTKNVFFCKKNAVRPCNFCTCSGEESTNGANLHICFSENIRFRVLMKNRTFLCKIKNFCTSGVTYK